jgi:hypothetical protein
MKSTSEQLPEHRLRVEEASNLRKLHAENHHLMVDDGRVLQRAVSHPHAL